MYLTDLSIENLGPIERLNLKLPFGDQGSPKPTILVGSNGSGKTVLLSTIADALFLMAAPHFQDIVPMMGLGHAYFKILGGSGQRTNSAYGIALIGFQHGSQKASYIEKTGTLDPNRIAQTLASRFPGATWKQEGESKTVSGLEPPVIQEIFKKSSICFFPSTRRELPHWLNVEAVGERRDFTPRLEENSKFSNHLGKPLFIERCREENKRWILDVMFDSRTEVVRNGTAVNTSPYDNLNDRLLLTTAKDNIDRILQVILNDPDVRLHANYRSSGPRLSVAKREVILLPSLDNLSLGQSLLFNLFCTIARYADRYDLNKGHQLEQIEGIVIIDEADAHLHTELQFTALPKLIKLFPRVQFVVTSHAPMFLLGMEKQFGTDGFAIYEMPDGESISTERFSEFKISLDHYRETKAFEKSIQVQILSFTKPTILVEGDTDRDYLIAYLEVLNRSDLLAAVNIDWAGKNVDGVARSGGKDSLDTIAKTFRAKLSLLQIKLLLIHDCDCQKQNETFDNKLFIRGIPLNIANGKFKRGIENLLPESVARPEFYDTKVESAYSGEIRTLNKRRLCNWVIQQRDPSLFEAFSPLLGFIGELIEK